MLIKKIKIRNFRNFNDLELNLSKKTTILVGDNTQGKTNFLESIYILSISKSFRTKDQNLILWEKDFFQIKSEIEKKERNYSLELTYQKKEDQFNQYKKILKVNKKERSLSSLLGILNSVFFSPEDLEIILGLPLVRRKYFDILISQIDFRYIHSLIIYKRIISQRNSLLKKIKEGLAEKLQLDIWNQKLVDHGVKIIEKRIEVVNALNKYLSKKHKILARRDDLEITYTSELDLNNIKESFLKKIDQYQERDILTCKTNIGPHRDDFVFLLKAKKLVNFASRGEIRTVVLALKLAEIEFLEEITGELPILLLDDVFSELDKKRRDELTKFFNNQQTIITTTDLDHIEPNYQKEATIYEVIDGELKRLIMGKKNNGDKI